MAISESINPRSSKTPSRRNSKILTLRCIIIKILKDKDEEGILKGAKEKQLVMYKGTLIGIWTDFFRGTIASQSHPNKAEKRYI